MNKQQIFKNAWVFIKTQGITKKEALKKAWLNYKIQNGGTAIFEINFTKIDGEITTRTGQNAKINEKGNLLFWSLNDNNYRSTKLGNINHLTYQTA
jgi:hypothetical protein